MVIDENGKHYINLKLLFPAKTNIQLDNVAKIFGPSVLFNNNFNVSLKVYSLVPFIL